MLIYFCTSTDDLIAKKYVDACTSTDDVCANENEPCTNENEPCTDEPCTNESEPCTNESEPCTNESEPCTNEPCTNESEPCTNENEPCTNENEPCTNESEPCTNEPCANENEACTNEPCTNENEPCTIDDDDEDDDNSSDIDIEKFYNFNDKVLGNLIIVSKMKKEFSSTIKKILPLLDKVGNLSKNDLGLKFDNYKELNILADYLINHIWITIYGNKRVNNEINNIDADKKDFNIYVRKYMNIVNDKISLINDILELINDLMSGIDENTSNDNGLKKLKQFKTQLNKLINRFNSYIKEDNKNISEPDTKNNTKPYSKDDIESNINDIIASIRKNQITVKKRYKSLLETKKTIRNNIDLVYSGLRKLSSESQLKANELNVIISDIKNKSNIDDIYNYSNKNKISMIYNDLEKYMKHLKRDIGSIKQNLKTISAYQSDSHKILMRFLK